MSYTTSSGSNLPVTISDAFSVPLVASTGPFTLDPTYYGMPSPLDLEARKQLAEQELEKHEKAGKLLTTINELDNNTKELLRLAYQLAKTGDMTILTTIDNLIRNLTFQQKLEKTLNK